MSAQKHVGVWTHHYLRTGAVSRIVRQITSSIEARNAAIRIRPHEGQLPPRELAAEELEEALVVRPIPLTKQLNLFDHRRVPASAKRVFGSNARGERNWNIMASVPHGPDGV